MGGPRTNSGDRLEREWKIPAVQTRYNRDGEFFMPLEKFPGALADPKGYILFQSFTEYRTDPDLAHPGIAIHQRLHVPRGIRAHRRYIRMKP